MRKTTVFSILLLAAFVTVIGCKGQKRPEGMPDLVPATFKLVQEGTPLEGAEVHLFTTTHGFGVYGKSNAEGIVELKTHTDDYLGAPAGEYKVTVTKVEITPSEFGEEIPNEMIAAQEWQAKRSAEYRPSFDLVNREYKKQATTTLTLTINADGTTDPTDLELGAATHDEFIPPGSASKPGMAVKPVEEE